MKKILLAILVMATMGLAQMPPSLKTTLFNLKTYASSQLDTVAGVMDGGRVLFIGGAARAGLHFSAGDTFALTKIYMDSRPFGGTVWTLRDSASTADITGAAPAGTNKVEWVFRSSVLDKTATITGAIRFRLSFKSSGQAVTVASRKYTLVCWYVK